MSPREIGLTIALTLFWIGVIIILIVMWDRYR